jgi:colanic acid/amylovoran biosynthesis glycosyltransferase
MRIGSLRKGPNDIHLIKSYVAKAESWRTKIQSWHHLLPFAGLRQDIIYFPWNSAAISHLPLFDFGSPVILSCRGSQVNVAPFGPQGSQLKKELAKTFEKATAVHCVSEAILNEATKYGLDPQKATVIRPAVDPEFFFPSVAEATPSNTFRITAVGGLIWKKGYDYALQSIRALKDRAINLQFNIVGSGDERDRVLFTIRDLGLQDVVRLHGSNPPEKVREILRSTDVLLLSSLCEGISNAVLEGMACGLPVVTTNCGGMREAVTDGVEGLVVPTRDVGAMSEALQVLWQDPQLRRRMGKAGRQRVEKSFSLSRQVQQFLSLCEQTAEIRVS